MRRSVMVEGFSHGPNPTPAASVVGNVLISGAIFGVNPATGKVAFSAEEQCSLMFAWAAKILTAGGCSFGDVVKMTVFLDRDTPRSLINDAWVVAFPDPASRSARHVIVSQTLPAGMLLQCDVAAIVGGGA